MFGLQQIVFEIMMENPSRNFTSSYVLPGLDGRKMFWTREAECGAICFHIALKSHMLFQGHIQAKDAEQSFGIHNPPPQRKQRKNAPHEISDK